MHVSRKIKNRIDIVFAESKNPFICLVLLHHLLPTFESPRTNTLYVAAKSSAITCRFIELVSFHTAAKQKLMKQKNS